MVNSSTFSVRSISPTARATRSIERSAVARSYGADLTVLHVLPVPSAVPALPYGPEGPGPVRLRSRRSRSRAGRAVAISRDRAADWRSAPLRSRRVAVDPQGSAHPDRPAVGRSRRDGTHGRSGFDHLFLGSVAEKTLRTSGVPVLVVPPHLPDVVPAGRDPFRSVLCAVDFSQDSARALDYAASLARHAAGRLTFCTRWSRCRSATTRWSGVTFDIAGYEAALEESARAQLQKLVPQATAGARARPS